MKCPVCNHKYKQGATICPNCSNKLHIETGTTPDQRNIVGSYRVHLNKKAVIALSITGVLLIAILIYALLKPSKNTGIIITDNTTIQSSSTPSVTPSTSPENQVANNNSQNETATESTSSTPETNSVSVSPSNQNNVNTAKVMDYRLRVRHKPSIRGRIVGHLPKGAEVIIIKKSKKTRIRLGRRYNTGFWYKISWEKIDDATSRVEKIIGWVWGKYLNFAHNN